MAHLHSNTQRVIDVSKWGEPFDPQDADDTAKCNQKIINGYILYQIEVLTETKVNDRRLHEDTQEAFEGWTESILQMATTTMIKRLKDFLLQHGVYIPAAVRPTTLAQTILTAIQSDYREWSSTEVTDYLMNYAASDENGRPIFISKNRSKSHLSTVSKPSSPAHTQNQYQPQLEPELAALQQPLTLPSSDPVAQTRRALTDLTKMYKEDIKFEGARYDTFESKYKIFQDQCAKVGIPPEEYTTAFSTMLKGKALEVYYDKISGKGYEFTQMCQIIKRHFHTPENRQEYLTEWMTTTFIKTINKNADKSRLECLRLLFDRLEKIQKGLPPEYQTDGVIRDRVINACREIDECELALFSPAATYEALCSQLQSAVATRMASRDAKQQSQFPQHYTEEEEEQCLVDRTFRGRSRPPRGRGNFRGNSSYGRQSPYNPSSQNRFKPNFPKKCYVCRKPGCWSTKHTPDERHQSFDKFKQQAQGTLTTEPTHAKFNQFLAEYEGIDGLDEPTEDNVYQLLMDLEIEESDQFLVSNEYTDGYKWVDGNRMATLLADQSTFHTVTGADIFKAPLQPNNTYTFEDRYSAEIFQGIMPDTGAAGVSTAGQEQFKALKKVNPAVTLNESTAGQHKIRFGKGEATNLGYTIVPTPFGAIVFQVITANTPFLLCLKDMDSLKIKFDNLENVLVDQAGHTVPIIRKWGHPWFLLDQPEQALAWCHLTEPELRQLHRRFGHPSVRRLHDILSKSGHEVEQQIIEHLTKYCHQCQMHSKAPGRFKFTLKDDLEFNFEIIIDVMYLDNNPVLHVIDSATSFQAARFLPDMSAKSAWDTLKLCWIDTYLGPPDFIISDAGKNFTSSEFKNNARAMAIDVKEVPVEAHNSIGKLERYHGPIRRAFEIIRDETKGQYKSEIILQMAIKAVNDSAGPNGLVPTLLVFGSYPRMTHESPPSQTTTLRAGAIQKAMKELRHIQANRQVNDALAMRNGPNTLPVITLPLQSDVRVFREKHGWTGPYKLLATDRETCTIAMPYGPTNFRSTVIKPYFRDEVQHSIDNPRSNPDLSSDPNESDPDLDIERSSDEDFTPVQQPDLTMSPPKRRGRPKGSKNKPKTTKPTSYLASKEMADSILAEKLRAEGKITTPGRPFEVSDRKEIDGLINNGVFRFEQYDSNIHGDTRIFKSRLVREVKGKATSSPYEKSRLVIQGYGDNDKTVILTQSPTIQRASQRLIAALTPSLIALPDRRISLQLRDITMAYTQSQTNLNRIVLAHPPKEIEDQHPNGTIMVVVKPLYGLAESGTHWWATYNKHHKEKLSMEQSTYDPCLLITTTPAAFGIVGMQTDDTLILADDEFSELENKELVFTAKPKETLSSITPLIFNGCVLTQTETSIELRQKEQRKKIQLVDPESYNYEQSYVEQRARGAYIASICQPEATFDLSVAAQNQQPTADDIKALNKRLQWQMENQQRGLHFIAIDLSAAKLYVFVDGSFANNKDLSSQIGFTIILANEAPERDQFTLKGNLIHWSSTKSKRVTRSVLASEIYGMVAGVDITFVMAATLKMITQQLCMPEIPIVIRTDSYSLYECIVKLGTTKEKRLMIDIMALRQMYERRELDEVRWINGNDNPADSMTKANPNKSLEQFLDSNEILIRVEGWVKRD